MTEPDSIYEAGREPAWLGSAFSQKIFNALGGAHVRFVGGAVRDSILGKPVSDIDMATTHKPETVMLKLKAAGMKVIPTGVAHGTITAVHKGEAREITTLRVDVETDGRRAAVAFTDDWQQDAARRDFTINALYLDHMGHLYDAFGGLNDLKARRVRFIGDAAKRIAEDGLRVLRFYRFSSFYADKIDADGQKACTENRYMIRHLSIERVREELMKLLAGNDPVAALTAMEAAGIVTEVFGEGYGLAALLDQVAFDQAAGAATTALSRLWLLAGNETSPAMLAKRFKLSTTQKKSLEAVGTALDDIKACIKTNDKWGDAAARELLYKFGPVVTMEAAHLSRNSEVARCVQQHTDWEPPVFPVSSSQLMARGVKPGPVLGRLLKRMEQEWIDSDFSLQPEQLLALADNQ